MSDQQPRDITAVTLSFVVAIRDQRDRIEPFSAALSRLAEKLGDPYEIIFVNDGSTDDTLDVLRRLREEDDRIRFVDLSRPFGPSSALSAGYDFASGAAVVTLDVDGRHPPEVIEEMVRKWRQGHEAVFGVRRGGGERECFLTRWAGRVTGVNVLAEDGLRLLDRKVVRAVRATRESDRFLPALVRWVGFRQTEVEYERPAGDEDSPVRGPHSCAVCAACATRAARAMDCLANVLNFSPLPMRLITVAGGAMAAGAVGYAVVALILWPILGASLVANLVLLAIGLTGLILAALGLVGEYVGRAYEEAKGRPLYVLREAAGFESPRRVPPVASTPAPTGPSIPPSQIRLFT